MGSAASQCPLKHSQKQEKMKARHVRPEVTPFHTSPRGSSRFTQLLAFASKRFSSNNTTFMLENPACRQHDSMFTLRSGAGSHPSNNDLTSMTFYFSSAFPINLSVQAEPELLGCSYIFILEIKSSFITTHRCFQGKHP